MFSACGESQPTEPGSGDPAPSPATPAEEAWFEEVGAAQGIDFVHTSGHTERYFYPEIVCGGGALFDMDGDGDLDAYLVQSGGILVDEA